MMNPRRIGVTGGSQKAEGLATRANNAPRRPHGPISFGEYILSPGWPGPYWGGPLEDSHFRRYLAGANIKSRLGLFAWVRDRYPEFYYRSHVFAGDITGREILRHVWARYLRESCR